MSNRSIAKAGELSARVGNVRLSDLSAPEYDRVLRRSWPCGTKRTVWLYITFSHVMVRVLIVPVSGSTDGVVDR